MTRVLPVIVGIAAALAAQVSSGAQNKPTGDAERGKQLFVKTGCYQCHGYEAQGASTGPRLGPEPIAFTRFATYVRKPSGDMPPYTARVMSDAQLTDIYAFVSARQKPSPRRIAPR
jgi:mono/diheme cytochrome c family protein